MHNLSNKNEFYLCVNENSFSYERLCTKTCFVKEAQDKSENGLFSVILLDKVSCPIANFRSLHTCCAVLSHKMIYEVQHSFGGIWPEYEMLLIF